MSTTPATSVSPTLPQDMEKQNGSIDDVIREVSDYFNEKLKPGIKVLFLNLKSDYPDLSTYIIDGLIINATNDGIVIPVDRDNLAAIQQEMDFQLSGEVSDESAQAIGKKLGAQSIVSGSIMDFDGQFLLVVRAIGVEDAAIQGQFRKDLPQSPRLASLTKNKTTSVINMMPSESPINNTNSDNATDESISSPETPLLGPHVSIKSFAVQMGEILDNAENGGDYTIYVNNSPSIGPQTLSFNGLKITIRIEGVDTMQIITLSSTGALFTIESGVTLILGKNITLKGISGNNGSLVYVNSGGSLIMTENSIITGNTYDRIFSHVEDRGSGGVTVNGGSFIMKDKTVITGNFGSSAGGVVINGGTLVMEGKATVSGNQTIGQGYDGGGIKINGGRLTMKDNSAVTGNKAKGGGGVSVSAGGSFIMQNRATVSGNTAAEANYITGGGVENNGTFIMEGGIISNNNSSYQGGGVASYGNFTLKNGIISGNNSGDDGGGVYSSGTFTMSGGTISGNTSGGTGGGICIFRGTFTKTSGIIAGNDGDTNSPNTSTNQGAAIYSDNSHYRNATAGEGVNTSNRSFWLND
jgi:hypothetical protein